MEHCPIAEELIFIADMTSGEPTGFMRLPTWQSEVGH